ncbi:mannose/glucose-specific lectin-like [Beta vulgaris subsp. vulgaris]|uniref:mannose/glucose-specific lectin n=1 Tax=Beta vulgaris subsp. vulgaris TaxID=3555 RepID=UPI0020372898|nr:mannose/glucose-specific lectin [Beta vulgaris subsp. vulgaris]XP_048502115.1 mannose/glucose-specific lectin-like [Beta vulgaris subsp. vulgaris]XP_048502116.1 mannose/glucose-specific lectin-like [Beta vulgaris subsp. vulgaris]
MAQAIAKNQIVAKYGPYGSQLPENYCMILKECEQIKEVIIRSGYIVDALGFVISKPCGGTETKMFGGNSGNESRIVLKCGEFITQISGTYGNYKYQNNECLIGTLKIHTNLCPSGYGPYGQGNGIDCPRSFSSPAPIRGPIVGFFGRHNNYLESTGIFVNEGSPCA